MNSLPLVVPSPPLHLEEQECRTFQKPHFPPQNCTGSCLAPRPRGRTGESQPATTSCKASPPQRSENSQGRKDTGLFIPNQTFPSPVCVTRQIHRQRTNQTQATEPRGGLSPPRTMALHPPRTPLAFLGDTPVLLGLPRSPRDPRTSWGSAALPGQLPGSLVASRSGELWLWYHQENVDHRIQGWPLQWLTFFFPK